MLIGPFLILIGDHDFASAGTPETVTSVASSAPSHDANPEKSVANLPFARGKRFQTLDEYLKHLENNGAIDLPWWREIGPGVYEHVRRIPGAPRETATRAELLRRFGLSR